MDFPEPQSGVQQRVNVLLLGAMIEKSGPDRKLAVNAGG